MKQHIDISQLNSLSPKAKERLRVWNGDPRKLATREKPNDAEQAILDNYLDLPLLSIGQMIEFLDEQADVRLAFIFSNMSFDGAMSDRNKLCDSLWQAVVDILEAE